MELLAPRPTLKLNDHPLSAVRDSTPYSIHFLSYAAYLEPFIHPQPEDTPRFGDSNPLTRDIKQGMTYRGHASRSTIFDTVRDGILRQYDISHVHRLSIRRK